MSLKSLHLELSALHPVKDVAPFFGCSAETLRDMCAAREVECTVRVGKDGRRRYLISENTIRAWRRTHRQASTTN